MKTRLYLYSVDQGWELQRLYNTAEFSERLDEELDTGNVQTITNSSVSFEDCCMARLTISDTFGKSIEGYFCGFDTIEKRGGGYFIHSLDLCEPTRLLMGVFIDGRRITQPLEETQKKKLYEVVKELLTTCETLNESETERFTLDEDSEPIALMKKLVAPEFHWEAGTSLWECLCDIANVINCIPRLIVNDALTAKTAFSVVVFDKVNEIPQTRTADWGDIEGEGAGSGSTGGSDETPEENPDTDTDTDEGGESGETTNPDTGETGGTEGEGVTFDMVAFFDESEGKVAANEYYDQTIGNYTLQFMGYDNGGAPSRTDNYVTYRSGHVLTITANDGYYITEIRITTRETVESDDYVTCSEGVVTNTLNDDGYVDIFIQTDGEPTQVTITFVVLTEVSSIIVV